MVSLSRLACSWCYVSAVLLPIAFGLPLAALADDAAERKQRVDPTFDYTAMTSLILIWEHVNPV
jgi:hypothetical protein